MKLEKLLQQGRTIRVIGFDDASFVPRHRGSAPISCIICAGNRGIVWGKVCQDGWNSTDKICQLLDNSKFLPQLHLVLLDGIAFGGFNIVDLPKLSQTLNLPCVTVMRRMPNLTKIEKGATLLGRRGVELRQVLEELEG